MGNRNVTLIFKEKKGWKIEDMEGCRKSVAWSQVSEYIT